MTSEFQIRQKNIRRENGHGGTLSLPSRTIVHPKLEVTEPGDVEEVEADRAACDVMNGRVCRQISGGGSCGGVAVPKQMESRLNHLQGGGQPLPDGLRSMMERGFGRDFSQVRLHTDGEAASMSRGIHAKAFTHGNDIYFNQGQFVPDTAEGQRLVAHELAHVAQGGGRVAREFDVNLWYLRECVLKDSHSPGCNIATRMKILECSKSKIDDFECFLVESVNNGKLTKFRETLPKILKIVEEHFILTENHSSNEYNWKDYYNKLELKEDDIFEFWDFFWKLLKKSRVIDNLNVFKNEYIFDLWGEMLSPFVEDADRFVSESPFISEFIRTYLAFSKRGNFYVTDDNMGIQRLSGFTDYIDEMGPLLGMDLDTAIIYFAGADMEKTFRLQLWKGIYGFGNALGGEVGLYYNRSNNKEMDQLDRQNMNICDNSINGKEYSSELFGEMWFMPVFNEDEVSIDQELSADIDQLSEGKRNVRSDSCRKSNIQKECGHFWNLLIEPVNLFDNVNLNHKEIKKRVTQKSTIKFKGDDAEKKAKYLCNSIICGKSKIVSSDAGISCTENGRQVDIEFK